MSFLPEPAARLAVARIFESAWFGPADRAEMDAVSSGREASPHPQIAALGPGTGAATAVFSLLDGVVLRPLPYREPERLVMRWE